MFHGFFTVPKNEVSFDEPIANSSMLVLPMSTVPAFFRPSTTNASYGAVKFASIREPQVVLRPAVIITSLCAIGTPASGGASPFASAASAARACASAPSASTVTNALSALCARSTRASTARVSSTLDSLLRAQCRGGLRERWSATASLTRSPCGTR